jgi:hypothetical protein
MYIQFIDQVVEIRTSVHLHYTMTVSLQIFVVLCHTVIYVNGWLLPPNGLLMDFNSEEITYDSVVFYLPQSKNKVPILTNTHSVKAVQQIKSLRYTLTYVFYPRAKL